MSGFFYRLKNIIYYLGACFCALLFALYCSGRCGYFLLYILIFAPIVSFLYFVCCAAFVTAEIELKSKILKKGAEGRCIIRLKNRGPLPLPLTITRTRGCPGVETEEWQSGFFLLPFEKKEKEFAFRAKYAGRGYICLDGVIISDFFCLLNKSISISGEKCQEFGVIPALREVTEDNRLLNELLQNANGQEEMEETLDMTGDDFGGFPGYDHREYRPGDPVKRINYKLSARRNELYVRLDEKMAKAMLKLRLSNLYEGEEPKEDADEFIKLCNEKNKRIWWQEKMEECFAVAAYLLDAGYELNLEFEDGKKNEEYVLKDTAQLSELMTGAAFWSFREVES